MFDIEFTYRVTYHCVVDLQMILSIRFRITKKSEINVFSLIVVNSSNITIYEVVTLIPKV